MQDLLKKYFGFDEFRPFQKEAIESVLDKNDTFVLMPTGGGKSLCYQLPALKFSGLTLVISPLIALMKDQVDSLKASGVNAEFVNSILSHNEIERVQSEALSGNLKILYIAPERLSMGGFRSFLKELNVNLIAVDEAHCISEWGHDFRPDYRNLRNLKNIFPGVPIVALTATATERVRKDILGQLQLEAPKTFISSFNRKNLHFRVIEKRGAFDKLLHLLEKRKGESAIIYCFSRKDTEKVAEDLQREGFNAAAYHAGLEREKRKGVQEQFINDKVDIIVATIAFGMGIDKPNVRLVIHYTFPKSLEGYYQEIGRAGRDGLSAECVMFYTYADVRKHEFFLSGIADDSLREQTEKKLREVMEYAELNTCRRKHLLSYFGETYEKENCGGCDQCLSEKEMFDGTIVAQKILSAIIRTGSRFGAGYIADVLLGKDLKQIRERGHSKLSVYGIVDDFSADQLREIIKSLLGKGIIKKADSKYPILRVTEKGKLFLKDKEKIQLPKPEAEKLSDKFRAEGEIECDADLFEKLKKIRAELASQMNVPPFVVFSDVALREMAYYFPVDRKSFLKISGVGAKKLFDFGETFLKEIKRHVNEKNLQPKEITGRRNKVKKEISGSAKSGTYQITKKLLKERMTISEIAEERRISEDTIIGHIEKLVASDQEIDIEHLKPETKVLEEIKRTFEKCENERLKPVYEELGGKYPYTEIRLVRLFLK